MVACGVRTLGAADDPSRVVVHELRGSPTGLWTTGADCGQPPPQAVVLVPRTGRPSVRRTTSTTSSTYRSASPRSAAVRTQPWTWSSRTRIETASIGGPEGGGLLEDVDAVLVALDHPRDPADLALDPAQAPHELRLVLAVAVTERRGRRAPDRGVVSAMPR